MLRGRSLIPLQLPSKQYRALQEEAVLRGGRSLNLYLLPQLSKDTVITHPTFHDTHTHHMTAQETHHESNHLDISYSHPTTDVRRRNSSLRRSPRFTKNLCFSTLVQGLSRSRKGKTFPGKNWHDSRWLGSGDEIPGLAERERKQTMRETTTHTFRFIPSSSGQRRSPRNQGTGYSTFPLNWVRNRQIPLSPAAAHPPSQPFSSHHNSSAWTFHAKACLLQLSQIQ